MAASAGDGGIGEAAEVTPARNRRTIYDYLGEGEDDGEGASASPSSPETPPRLRLPRFTCARIRFGRLGTKRGGKGGGRKEDEAAEKSEDTAAEKSEDASVDSSGWNQAAAASSGGGGGGSVAGGQTGMGLSMLLLLARTGVELNRMAEVRAQMETLLKEMRDEASRVKGSAADHVLVTPKDCNNLQSLSSSSSSCVSDTSTSCLEIRHGEDDGKRASEDEWSAGTEDVVMELEAELKTEPARRRQPPERQCDAEQETPPECSVHSSSDGEFIELEAGRFVGAVVDESSWERRRHEGGGGVSATELERRLHELQHRRDRERIEALESALRRAQRKLTEKEMEARLWQDTATLALGQPMPPERNGQ